MDYSEVANPVNPKAGRGRPFDGGPAYPVTSENGLGHISDGMTLRAYYAGLALPWALESAMGMIDPSPSPCPLAARLAVEAADALLAELAKGGDA